MFYISYLCLNCLLINSGLWGPLCGNICDCEHGAECHHVTGRCTCPDGFTGDKCQFSK